MATVNFCEREQCQTMGKSIIMGTLAYSVSETAKTERIEICPGCVAEFMEWLASAPANVRPRAYQDAYDPKATPNVTDMTGEALMKMAMDKMRKELEA